MERQTGEVVETGQDAAGGDVVLVHGDQLFTLQPLLDLTLAFLGLRGAVEDFLELLDFDFHRIGQVGRGGGQAGIDHRPGILGFPQDLQRLAREFHETADVGPREVALLDQPARNFRPELAVEVVTDVAQSLAQLFHQLAPQGADVTAGDPGFFVTDVDGDGLRTLGLEVAPDELLEQLEVGHVFTGLEHRRELLLDDGADFGRQLEGRAGQLTGDSLEADTHTGRHDFSLGALLGAPVRVVDRRAPCPKVTRHDPRRGAPPVHSQLPAG